MKAKIIILSILFGTGFLMVSCTPSEPPTSSEIYIVVDVTASAENKNHPLNLNAEKITRLFEFDTKPKASAKYSQSIISEVHLNQEFSEELESANPAKFNPYRRKATVKNFVVKVENAVKDLENTKYDRESSNIFIALANIINKVAKNDKDRQLVIIQSDMLDNSFMFSAYNKQQMEKVENSPEFLTEILEKHTPITQSLKKMRVVILYQPNAQTDFSFRLLTQRYKDYLLSKGVKSVEIMANL
jgi:hypothetical protein